MKIIKEEYNNLGIKVTTLQIEENDLNENYCKSNLEKVGKYFSKFYNLRLQHFMFNEEKDFVMFTFKDKEKNEKQIKLNCETYLSVLEKLNKIERLGLRVL